VARVDEAVVVDALQDLAGIDHQGVAGQLVGVGRLQVSAGIVLGVAGHPDPDHPVPLRPVLFGHLMPVS